MNGLFLILSTFLPTNIHSCLLIYEIMTKKELESFFKDDIFVQKPQNLVNLTHINHAFLSQSALIDPSFYRMAGAILNENYYAIDENRLSELQAKSLSNNSQASSASFKGFSPQKSSGSGEFKLKLIAMNECNLFSKLNFPFILVNEDSGAVLEPEPNSNKNDNLEEKGDGNTKNIEISPTTENKNEGNNEINDNNVQNNNKENPINNDDGSKKKDIEKEEHIQLIEKNLLGVSFRNSIFGGNEESIEQTLENNEKSDNHEENEEKKQENLKEQPNQEKKLSGNHKKILKKISL